ncbi:MAG: peptidoglycan-binding protein [Minisyncoccia bacterium]
MHTISVSKNLLPTSVFSVLFLAVLFTAGSGHANAALTTQLGLGSTGSDVTALQQFLATNPLIYPQGAVTGYFGALTEAAVTQFQVSYGIAQVGRVGPATLAKINAVMNSGLGLDTSVPVISNFSATTNSNGATLSWSTNEPAQGQVYYSTQPIQSNEATAPFQQPYISGTLAQNTTPQTNESITITGLQPSTTYNYVIRSIDRSDNVTMTPASNLTTGN